MSEVGANTSADTVSQAPLGADVVEEARGESSTERFVENTDGVIVGIVTRYAEAHHTDVALVHIIFGDQIVAGLRGRILHLRFLECRALGPRLECGTQARFHGGRIEIPGDPKN